MDRRTLIAFVLATVVLIGWSLLFPTPRPKHPAPAVDSTVALGAPGASAVLPEGNVPRDAGPTGGAIAEPVTPGNGGASWRVAQAETLEVDTDLLHARIHTHGGGLVGLLLKEFPLGDRSGPVNLVRAGQEALDVIVEWRPSTIPAIPLAGAMYAVTRSPFTENDQRGERIVLTAERADGLRVTREYRFQNGSYVIGHHVRVEGLSAPGGAPALVIGWRSGIPFTELTHQSDQPNFSSLIRVGDEIHLWGPGKFKDGPRIADGAVRWAAVGNKYFMAAMLPAPNAATAAGADGDPTSSRTAAWLYLPAAASDRAEAEIRLYAGPKDIQRVEAADPGLVDAVSLGYRWMRPITLVMVRVLKATYQVVPNYGWVIIILSILVRVLLFPLNQTSMRSMKAMQRLQPEMEAIRKKYADKPQEMNKQVMLLYQKNKVNPLGGCLPMVVQMPVLFALYFSLMFAIDLRMAPFVSWIHDLSAPDTVGKIAGFPIHVLPLIMTAVSVLQARSTPTDPRQAAMTTLMPIVFLVFFYNMPAGLVLYWTMTNLGTWLQQRWVNRMDGASAGAAATTTESEIEASEPKAKPSREDSRGAKPESAGGLPVAGNGGRSRKEADRSMPKPRGKA